MNDMPTELYRVVVSESRYKGAYEGGQWLAWSHFDGKVPEDAFGDDVRCMTFFDGIRDARIGRGATPDEAIADLLARWRADGQPNDGYDWNAEP